jgi:acyl dehydratase
LYKIRFTGQVWPGETITCKAKTVRKYEQDGEKLIDCALSVVNASGDSKIEGAALVALPTKE